MRSLVYSILLLGPPACSETVDSVCEPRQVVTCAGPAGCDGVQRCSAKGDRWESCNCDLTEAELAELDAPDAQVPTELAASKEPLSVGEFLDALRHLYCQSAVDCCSDHSYRFEDYQGCVDWLEESNEEMLLVLEDERVRFDGVVAQAWLAELEQRTLNCEPVRPTTLRIGYGPLMGTVAVGENCSFINGEGETTSHPFACEKGTSCIQLGSGSAVRGDGPVATEPQASSEPQYRCAIAPCKDACEPGVEYCASEIGRCVPVLGDQARCDADRECASRNCDFMDDDANDQTCLSFEPDRVYCPSRPYYECHCRCSCAGIHGSSVGSADSYGTLFTTCEIACENQCDESGLELTSASGTCSVDGEIVDGDEVDEEPASGSDSPGSEAGEPAGAAPPEPAGPNGAQLPASDLKSLWGFEPAAWRKIDVSKY